MKTPHFVFAVTAALALAACSRPEAPQEPIRSVKLITVSASSVGAQNEYVSHWKVAGRLIAINRIRSWLLYCYIRMSLLQNSSGRPDFSS